MKKFGRILMIALVALVFLGTFAYLFKRSQPKAVEYQELTPSRGDIVRSTVVTGKIQPRDEVNVKPQINGIIAEMYKEAGETVQQNEVIAKLKVIPDMNQPTDEIRAIAAGVYESLLDVVEALKKEEI